MPLDDGAIAKSKPNLLNSTESVNGSRLQGRFVAFLHPMLYLAYPRRGDGIRTHTIGCMKSTLVLVLVLISLLPARAQTDGDSTLSVHVFPGSKIFRPFTADALSHNISLSRLIDNRDWIGTIGASVPLVTVKPPGEVTFQLSIAVSVFNRLIKPPGLTVYTIDYKVDFPLDLRIHALALRFAYGHYSCHFVDDGIEIIGKRSIQSVKDHLWMGAAYDIRSLGGHVYAAGFYFFNNSPVRSAHWQFQGGVEAGNIEVTDFARIYAAIDLKFKQEVHWGSTRSFQVGLRLFPHASQSLRVAYTLRQGYDERGQFFDRTEEANMISLFVDL